MLEIQECIYFFLKIERQFLIINSVVLCVIIIIVAILFFLSGV